MTTVEQILDELRRGVDDQTWSAHVQRLQEHGAQVRDGVTTAGCAAIRPRCTLAGPIRITWRVTLPGAGSSSPLYRARQRSPKR